MTSILITGCAGFIGVNCANQFAQLGWRVIVVDNLSRRGADANLEWLQGSNDISFEHVDIRDRQGVQQVLKATRPNVLLLLAAQVVVTTSVTRPMEDFEINAGGSLNLLDAVRIHSSETYFINASTNKVYGKMEDLDIVERNG